jgi:hypothetical protein
LGESLLLLPLHSTTDLSLYFTVGKELSCDRTIWTLRLVPLSAFTLNNTDGTPHATTPNQCSHPGSRNGVTSRACRMNTDPNSRQHRRREFSSSPNLAGSSTFGAHRSAQRTPAPWSTAGSHVVRASPTPITQPHSSHHLWRRRLAMRNRRSSTDLSDPLSAHAGLGAPKPCVHQGFFFTSNYMNSAQRDSGALAAQREGGLLTAAMSPSPQRRRFAW